MSQPPTKPGVWYDQDNNRFCFAAVRPVGDRKGGYSPTLCTWLIQDDGCSSIKLAELEGNWQHLGDKLPRLHEAIWPGLPKWEPTAERPKQDFYEAVLESLREPVDVASAIAAFLATNPTEAERRQLLENIQRDLTEGRQ